jgi:hypothetical protein
MFDIDAPLNMHALAQGQLLLAKLPSLGPGQSVTGITDHWSVGPYDVTFPDAPLVNGDNDGYHVCVPMRSDVFVAELTADSRLNAIDVSRSAPYIAHSAGLNSHRLGVAVCAMDGATPEDFGPYPVTVHQLEVMCAANAALGAKYRIDLTDPAALTTHAVDAINMQYFPGDPTDPSKPESGPPYRWDLARRIASSAPLTKVGAIAECTEYRIRSHAYKLKYIG